MDDVGGTLISVKRDTIFSGLMQPSPEDRTSPPKSGP